MQTHGESSNCSHPNLAWVELLDEADLAISCTYQDADIQTDGEIAKIDSKYANDAIQKELEDLKQANLILTKSQIQGAHMVICISVWNYSLCTAFMLHLFHVVI